jgi:hypothetical protein
MSFALRSLLVAVGVALSAVSATAAAQVDQVSRAELPDAPTPAEAADSGVGAGVAGPSDAGIFSPRPDPMAAWGDWAKDSAAEERRGPELAEGRPVDMEHPLRLDVGPMVQAFFDRPEDGGGAGTQQQAGAEQHYHWKGLLWQSFGFFGVENAWRLATDPYFKYLTADKPFWHDYLASLQQWNMRRWSDGDDFLVAYIGHPLQGSVTEFIEIQNDPHDRMLEFGSDPRYWRSRLKSMMWATLYSTDQKVGPLGETALGSEGGYTYVIGCPYYCSSYNPATDKVTNNTGWVKFITTPVVGTLWTVVEDFLDREVGDRVQRDRLHASFPKILRGSLNPSRTMANLLRGRNPWWRDYQHPDFLGGPRFLPDPEKEQAIRGLPRYEVFPHLNALSLPVNASAACAPCRGWTGGFGVGFRYLAGRWWSLDADVDRQPNASPLPSDHAGGDVVMGNFGVGFGLRTPNYSLMASVRPGFLTYDAAYKWPPMAGGPAPALGHVTQFTTALAITADYGIARHLAMRLAVGNTPVRYNTYRLDRPPGVGSEPYLDWISPKVYLTNENWTVQTGPVLRF